MKKCGLKLFDLFTRTPKIQEDLKYTNESNNFSHPKNDLSI